MRGLSHKTHTHTYSLSLSLFLSLHLPLPSLFFPSPPSLTCPPLLGRRREAPAIKSAPSVDFRIAHRACSPTAYLPDPPLPPRPPLSIASYLSEPQQGNIEAGPGGPGC